jgi:hypothetical protein
VSEANYDLSNIVFSDDHNPEQEIVATCAACGLFTRKAAEGLDRGHQGDQVGGDCGEVAEPLVGTGLLD